MSGGLRPRGEVVLLLAVLLVLAWGDFGGATAQTLPLNLPDGQWHPLARCWDKHLQIGLDRLVRSREEWHSLIYQKKMAVGLVDLGNPAQPRFGQVNGDTMMYAASLPKLAVLLAAFQALEGGTLRPTPDLQRDLIEMIRRSDNSAANRVINRVGLAAVEAAVRDPRYRFYEPRHGGLWVGSRYGAEPEPNPEPLKNLLHAATAAQVCNFYYLLACGR